MEAQHEMLELLPAPDELKHLLSGNAIAIIKLRWRGEPRILILAGFSDGARAYIAPPIPSLYCSSSLTREDEILVKYVLRHLGLSFYSACRVLRELLRPSIEETINNIRELLDLELGNDGA